MVNKKLQEVGSKLNVSKGDIRNIQNTSFKDKLTGFFILPALRVILAILTFILGVSLGRASYVGYPFTAAAVGIAMPKSRKKSVIHFILLPIITFIAGYLISYIFGQAIMYNVYKRL